MREVFHSRAVQAISAWLTILVAGWTALANLAPTVFGERTLPESIVIGIALALSTSLIAAIALAVFAWGFRLLRPLATRQSSPNGAEGEGHLSAAQLSAELHAIRVSVGQLEAELENAKDGEESLRASIQGFMKAPMSLTMNLTKRLDKRLSERIDTLSEKIEKLGELNNQSLDYARSQVSSLYDALAAVYHRERLQELGHEIETRAAVLGRPTTEKASYDADAWEEWEQLEDEWRERLDQWVSLAEAYKPGAFKAVTYTPEKLYRGSWSVDDHQFPTSTAAYAYKTFRIRLKNWEELRDEVDNKVQKIAFDGGTATSRPIVRNSILDILKGEEQ